MSTPTPGVNRPQNSQQQMSSSSSSSSSSMSKGSGNSDIIYQFKILLIGDSGVGKTSLMSRFKDNKFNLETKSTVGVQYARKNLTINNESIFAQIWDTAGQERFRAMAPSYYKGALGALIVFDLTQTTTFENVEKVWLHEIQNHGTQAIQIIVVGNQSDLQDERCVQTEVVQEFCQQNNLAYIETSALDTSNVEEAFIRVCRAIYDDISNIPEKDQPQQIVSSLDKIVLDKAKTTEKQQQNCCE